ncbi:hypothetical protein HN371_29260 [Candidatus Poribacteria bacterium]|jgi:hypothetical protein|nr:hypothetical protein [Candidatus Poribacteria bacterium]MBT5533499.1 hypothetical protein [Candidatus Poribacteria bacterium]MBT5710131.1 hypothetical protein [Candidatus Poribacteria bacterium]MBT7100536.1 hypothetical protein [Candidatus Poribacteria bacterium]MBT7808896.1 hypothetical protein [Candidatus Poribacteria bacterium]
MTYLVESLKVGIEQVTKADELTAAGLVQAVQAAESLEPFEAMVGEMVSDAVVALERASERLREAVAVLA